MASRMEKQPTRRPDYPPELALKFKGVDVCQIKHVPGKSCNNADRKRSHLCPIRNEDGHPCAGDHAAKDCPLTTEQRKNGFGL